MGIRGPKRTSGKGRHVAHLRGAGVGVVDRHVAVFDDCREERILRETACFVERMGRHEAKRMLVAANATPSRRTRRPPGRLPACSDRSSDPRERTTRARRQGPRLGSAGRASGLELAWDQGSRESRGCACTWRTSVRRGLGSPLPAGDRCLRERTARMHGERRGTRGIVG
jgi:hypothetical protein